MDLGAHPIFKHSGWHWTSIAALICFALTASILIFTLTAAKSANAITPDSHMLHMTK